MRTGSFLHSPLLDELRAMEAILACDNAAAAEAALAAAAAAGAVHPAAEDSLLEGDTGAGAFRLPPTAKGGLAGEEGQKGGKEEEKGEGRDGAELGARLSLPLLASLAESPPEAIEEEGDAGAAPPPLSPMEHHLAVLVRDALNMSMG